MPPRQRNSGFSPAGLIVISFSDAKNGEKTCSLAGKHIHSAYNPSREAEQFVLHLNVPFNPAAVIIIEPALSYCLPFLRKRFPDARLCAVRVASDFSESDDKWDVCLYAKNDCGLGEQLFSALGEETLCSAVFFSWTAAESVFPEDTKAVWQEIKSAVLKSRDVLATRSFFATRWLKNTVKYCVQLKNPALIKKGTCDIVVAASGPSLMTSIPKLKAFRDDFFLIAVSSALLPLLAHHIRPDLVISTDGGYWAKKHLEANRFPAKDIPYAIAAEGSCPAELLEHSIVVPLYYEDGLEKEFLADCKIPAMSAQRNGTVSGTAAEFALSLTEGNIFFCGLDLAKTPAEQHCAPNALEQLKEIKDNRLNPKENRIAAAASGNEGALAVYRNWFTAESYRLGKRLYRLSKNHAYPTTLGKIQDINWETFERIRHRASKKPEIVRCEKKNGGYEEKLILRIQALEKTESFARELCPVETMLKKRAFSEDERRSYEATISEKTTAFAKELEKLIYG